MILLDFSQIAYPAIYAFQKELVDQPQSIVENILRNTILSSIKYYKSKYSTKYGEIILCTDGRNYWRKKIFPHYKSGRKKAKDKSPLDWDMLMSVVSKLRDEIRDNFPYKLLHLDHVEADDIIATLSKWSQENEHVQDGLFSDKQMVLVVSSDGDFQQLHIYDNLHQYSPKNKKFINISKQESLNYLREHILRGDVGDGISSIYCPPDFFVNKHLYGRAKSITVSIAN